MINHGESFDEVNPASALLYDRPTGFWILGPRYNKTGGNHKSPPCEFV